VGQRTQLATIGGGCNQNWVTAKKTGILKLGNTGRPEEEGKIRKNLPSGRFSVRMEGVRPAMGLRGP